jgi:hypothetical protein
MRVVKRVDTMDTRAPDLQQLLGAMASASPSEMPATREDESCAQEVLLKQLADRVNAARSIV